MESNNGFGSHSDFRSFSDINDKQRSSKKRKVIFIISGLILCIALTIYFLPSILGLFASDIPPIDDSDLQLKEVSLAPESNAFYDIINMDKVFAYDSYDSELIDSYLEGNNWDDQSVEEILSNNEQALEYFTLASNKPSFQDPNFDSPEKISFFTVISGVRSLVKIAHLSSLKAIYLSRHSDYATAVNEALKSLRVAQKIEDSQALSINYLLACSLKNIGLNTLRRIVSSADLSSEDLIKYTQQLENFSENRQWIITAFKIEYRNVVGAIDLAMAGDPEYLGYVPKESKWLAKRFNNSFYFQPNKTKKLFADYARVAIANVEKPCGLIEETRKDLFYAGNEMPSEIRLIFTENLVGKLLSDIMAVSSSALYKKSCQTDLALSATRVLFAIKAYKLDKKDYPEALIELVPEYFSTIPKDPFSGGNIKYSKERKIIYSVGQDLVDSGGSQGDDWQKMEDPTFVIEF